MEMPRNVWRLILLWDVLLSENAIYMAVEFLANSNPQGMKGWELGDGNPSNDLEGVAGINKHGQSMFSLTGTEVKIFLLPRN